VRPFLGPYALFRSPRHPSSVARRAFWIGRSTVAGRKSPGSGGEIAGCLDAQSEPGGAEGRVAGDCADKQHRVAASLTALFLRNVKFVRQMTSRLNARQGVSDRCIAPQNRGAASCKTRSAAIYQTRRTMRHGPTTQNGPTLAAARMDRAAQVASSLSDLGVRKRNDGRARTDFDDFDAHIGNM
jgi:hypothetical protein